MPNAFLPAVVNKCDVNPLAAPVEADGISVHVHPSLRKKPPDLPDSLAALGRKVGGTEPHPHFPAVVETVLLDAADIKSRLARAPP
jgi:hypothetical protein